MRGTRIPLDYMDREARGAHPPAARSRQRATMESGMTGHRNVRFSTQPAEKYKKSIEKLPETSENQVSFGACLGHPEISGSFCAFKR